MLTMLRDRVARTPTGQFACPCSGGWHGAKLAPTRSATHTGRVAFALLAGCMLSLAGCAGPDAPSDAASAVRAGDTASAEETLPVPGSGRIERWSAFPSTHVPARHVDIWLPEGYPAAAPYAVVYMHDGQMLFDARHTWNHQEWQADEVAARLMASAEVRPFIIVGIHNGGPRRHSEYFPQRPFESLPDAERNALLAARRSPDQPLFAAPVASDAYLRFLVEELKPEVDRRFAVASGRDSTFVLGSSMGGLISMYAALEYPDVFGAAACLSTHWPGTFQTENNPMPSAFRSYVENALPDPGRLRFYFDHGTATLDALYPPLQDAVDRVFLDRGYDSSNFLSLEFPGAEHSEQAWAARLDRPLRFLLGRDGEGASATATRNHY